MITLALVRHAKSDWAERGLADHDRPLNARGRRDAPAAAARLAATGFRPEVILASTAVRARITAEAFAAVLSAPVSADDELYLADASTILRAAARTRAERVMVVAHDPGMSILAAHLSDDGIAEMPTCAVATFVWDTGDWDVATAVPPASWSFDSPHPQP
jgi:phosphohistidine phosphatase